MSNPNRDYDKTHLSIDTAEERILIHRDYLAHCLRWSHVVKHLYKKHAYKTARILDIGCGREVPLAKLLYSNKMSGARYTGVDMNRLEMPEMLKKASDNGKLEIILLGQTDASQLTINQLMWKPNIITCFECWEHIHPQIALRLVKNAYNLLAEDGVMFFSTPVWNGDAAANHINETTYHAMAAILNDNGFIVQDHFGTFASQREYEHLFTRDQLTLYNRLQQYYDSNVLACIFAPAFPQASRNVHWVCTKGVIPVEKRLPDAKTPWSQHRDWGQLNT